MSRRVTINLGERSVTDTVMGVTLKEISEKRRILRSKLPILTKEQILRHRLVPCDAIAQELELEGNPAAAEFIRKLVYIDDENIEKAKQDGILRPHPALKHNINCLDIIKHGLQAAQAFLTKDYKVKQILTLLELAFDIIDLGQEFSWIAGEILKLCITFSETIKIDKGQINATSRYMYGLYLVKFEKNLEAAESHLEIARKMSEGITWMVKKDILKRINLELHTETCKMLSEVLLERAADIRSKDPQKAVRLCNIANDRALKAQDQHVISRAIYELGVSMIATGQYVEAVKRLEWYIETCQYLDGHEEHLCTAHMHLARAYQSTGNLDSYYYHLQEFQRLADQHQFADLSALARLQLGEAHLNKVILLLPTQHSQLAMNLQQVINLHISLAAGNKFSSLKS